MRRFYREVRVIAADRGHGIQFDGKPLRTPAKAELILPGQALAKAIAAEWRAQSDTIDLRALPLTRLASSAIDLVATRRDAVIAETADYAGTDLLCYRAAHPPELARRQEAAWQPLLDWAAARYDAPLIVTTGIAPVAQPPASLAAFATVVGAQDSMRLAALRLATAAAGSLVIALALLEGRLDTDAAFAAAELDETFQIENWGEDPERTKRRAILRDDLALAARFASLLTP
jgi:chaperone required for assembly of F1-ATPase